MVGDVANKRSDGAEGGGLHVRVIVGCVTLIIDKGLLTLELMQIL